MIGFIVKRTPRLILYGFLLLSLAAPGGPAASAPTSNNEPPGSNPPEDYFVASPVTSYQFLDAPEEYFAASPVVSYQFFDAADQYFVASPIVSYQYLDSPSDLFTASAVVSYQYDSPPSDVQPQPNATHSTTLVEIDSHLWQWNNSAKRFVQPTAQPDGTFRVTIDPTKPTYILAHGWDSELDGIPIGTPCGGTAYAMSSIGCALHQAKPDANLLAWEWKAGANPNGRKDGCEVKRNPLAWPVLVEIFLHAPDWATIVTLQLSSVAHEAFLDALLSGSNATWEGVKLGKALARVLQQNQGALGSELHFIGHSHGGAVVGTAAQIMKNRAGVSADSLTTLDTPKTGFGASDGVYRIDSIQHVNPTSVRNGGRVAAIYYDDVSVGGFGKPILSYSGDKLTNLALNPDYVPTSSVAHTWLPGSDEGACPPNTEGWYDFDIWNFDIGHPFGILFNSNPPLSSVLDVLGFPPGCYSEGGPYEFATSQCQSGLREALVTSESTSSPGMALLSSEPFDTAASWSGANAALYIGPDTANPDNRVILLTENGDASLFKDIDWPTRAIQFSFDYIFREPRGDASLTVYLNGQIVYYDSADVSLTGEQLTPSKMISVLTVAGSTARLEFVLRPGTTPGSGVVLDNIHIWGALGGDMNGDGKLDGLDIQPFVNALLATTTDPAAVYIADLDSNGVVDIDDVAPFVTALLGS